MSTGRRDPSISQLEQSDERHPVDPDFDPLDPDYLADPHFARFGREAPIFCAPKIDFWVISRYDDIMKIVSDPETFSNAGVEEPLHPLAPDENNLSLEECISVAYSVSFAGHETTTNAILNGLRQLLARPELLEELRENPSLIENAVEEVLRRDTSVVSWRRSTTRPLEISGVHVPEGARLMLLLASANRDESVFEDPDAFDIHRENANKHIAFSHGIHFCLGAPLARLEALIAFELLTQRLPDLRLYPPDQRFEYDPNMSFRGPKELWAEWTPVCATYGVAR
jgi:cytochrome P450